jgi:outer membrane lipoprotein LolB
VSVLPARRVLALAALAWLAGCAGLTTRPPPDLAGRLAVQIDAAAGQPARSFSAEFDLRGDAQRGRLRLTGPLGGMLADVRWEPGGAELTDAQGPRRYATLDAMTQDLFGEALPLAAVIDWLRGRPWPGAPSRTAGDGFEQLEWRVGLARFFAEGVLEARRERAPAVSLRARLERPS